MGDGVDRPFAGEFIIAAVFVGVEKKPALPDRKTWKFVLSVGVLDALALTSYNVGLKHEQTAIVITAASLFAVVTLCWGVFLEKERLARNQWFGVLLTFAGIIIISLRGD